MLGWRDSGLAVELGICKLSQPSFGGGTELSFSYFGKSTRRMDAGVRLALGSCFDPSFPWPGSCVGDIVRSGIPIASFILPCPPTLDFLLDDVKLQASRALIHNERRCGRSDRGGQGR